MDGCVGTDGSVKHDDALSKKAREYVIGAFAPSLRVGVQKGISLLCDQVQRHIHERTHRLFDDDRD